MKANYLYQGLAQPLQRQLNYPRPKHEHEYPMVGQTEVLRGANSDTQSSQTILTYSKLLSESFLCVI